MLAAVAVLDSADRMSSGLESHPLPYFLALVLAVAGVLWSTIATIIWWSARSQRDLYKQLLSQERERSQELKRERDESRDETDRVRSDHMKDLVKLTMAAEGLVRIHDEMVRKRPKAATP